jgi:hypothetical protein
VDDPNDLQCRNRKIDSETYLLRWLQRHSDINVPCLLEVYVARGNRTTLAQSNFIIMNKIQGSMLINLYGNLPTAIKVWNVRFQSDCASSISQERLISSYTDLMLKIFSLEVPQKISSLASGPSLSTPGVAPKFGLRHFVSADKVFCDIREFFDFEIYWRR